MRGEALSLLVLTVLAIAGLRCALRNWRDWLDRARGSVDAAREAFGAHSSVRVWLLQPVFFAGVYSIVLLAWLTGMAVAGVPVVLLALLVVFPGSVIAYHAARIFARLIRRFV